MRHCSTNTMRCWSSMGRPSVGRTRFAPIAASYASAPPPPSQCHPSALSTPCPPFLGDIRNAEGLPPCTPRCRIRRTALRRTQGDTRLCQDFGEYSRRGAGEAPAGGTGGVPQPPNLPPRVGAKGLKTAPWRYRSFDIGHRLTV